MTRAQKLLALIDQDVTLLMTPQGAMAFSVKAKAKEHGNFGPYKKFTMSKEDYWDFLKHNDLEVRRKKILDKYIVGRDKQPLVWGRIA